MRNFKIIKKRFNLVDHNILYKRSLIRKIINRDQIYLKYEQIKWSKCTCYVDKINILYDRLNNIKKNTVLYYRTKDKIHAFLSRAINTGEIKRRVKRNIKEVSPNVRENILKIFKS